MNKDKIQYLFQQYFNKTASTEEKEEFLDCVEKNENADNVKALMKEFWEGMGEHEVIFSEEKSEEILVQINREMVEEEGLKPERKSLHFLWPRVAAAVIGLVIVGASFLYFNRQRTPVKMQKEVVITNDVQPGGNIATLTLSSGKKINLNNAGNGMLARQGKTKVVKQGNGLLAYNHQENESGSKVRNIQYNTLATPRGGQYQLELPDGTKVWLNAASSIRFPTAFAGKERKVEVTGEAYFEVAPNEKMPFKVVTKQMTIKVLGTHFNVNAYADAPRIRTTLLEGSVKISTENNSVILRPGQQADINRAIHKLFVSKAKMEEAVAWKNDIFHFQGDALAGIMRRIARWYDVSVVYTDGIPPGHYTGVISRNTNLSQVLKVLELSGVHFEIQGKTIVVK